MDSTTLLATLEPLAGKTGLSAAEAALIVAVASAAISLASLVWNLVLFHLSGARLSVRLTPAALTSHGHLIRGPDSGWRKPIPETIAKVQDDHYVDLAIIKVTNVGRTAVSVSDITFDFGRSGWRPGWRHTVGGTSIPIHECREVSGDVRLEAGESFSVAIDDQPIIDYARANSSFWHRAVRASATAAGRRPTRSSWRRRWRITDVERLYLGAVESPERSAFVEVFRAVYPHDAKKVYEAWTATTALLLRDAEADASAVAKEIGRVLDLDELATINLVVAGLRVTQLLPTEVSIGKKKWTRGDWGPKGQGT